MAEIRTAATILLGPGQQIREVDIVNDFRKQEAHKRRLPVVFVHL